MGSDASTEDEAVWVVGGGKVGGVGDEGVEAASDALVLIGGGTRWSASVCGDRGRGFEPGGWC